MVVSYRIYIVTIMLMLSLAIWPQFVIKCLRRSNQQGMGHYGAKFGEDWLTDVSQILTRSGRYAGWGVACKRIVSISSVIWAQCTNVTDRQADDRMATSIAKGKIA